MKQYMTRHSGRIDELGGGDIINGTRSDSLPVSCNILGISMLVVRDTSTQ